MKPINEEQIPRRGRHKYANQILDFLDSEYSAAEIENIKNVHNAYCEINQYVQIHGLKIAVMKRGNRVFVAKNR